MAAVNRKQTLLAVYIVSISFICCLAREEALRRLNLNEVPVLVTGNCCPVGEGRPCIPNQCPIASPASIITDGNAFTEWLFNFTSTGTDGSPPQVVVMFDFEQLYRIHSVTLLSTMEPLPREWKVTVTSDMASQTVARINDDGVFQQSVVLGGEKEPIQSSKLQIAVTLPTATYPDPIALAELIIAINDLTLPEDVGCGVCVERLSTILDEMIADLRNASSTLDSLVNQTQIRLLSQSTNNLEFVIGGYEDFLRVVGVVLGVTPPLDDNVTLAERVPRLDLQLVPPIPGKLNLLEEVINRTSTFEFDLSDLESDLNEVMLRLLNAQDFYSQLVGNVSTFRSNFVELIDTLDGRINGTGEALNEVNRIHGFVTRTNFSQARDSLARYKFRVEVTRNSSEALVETLRFTHEQVLEGNLSVSRVYDMLSEALEIIDQVAEESESALQTVATVDTLVEQIKALLSEGKLLNASISSSVATIRSNLDNYLELIETVNSSLQLICGHYVDLRSLIASLRVEVTDYMLRLSPFRLPQSCDLSLPCASYEVYASTLFTNASEIVNSSTTIYTLQRVREFLASIAERGQLFDYSSINETATLAFEMAQQALAVASNLTLGRLIDDVCRTIVNIEALEENSAMLRNTTNGLVSRAGGLQLHYLELYILLKDQQDNADMLRNETDILKQRTGLAREAGELFRLAEEANNRSVLAENKIISAEEALEGVADDIIQTRSNVQEAADALNAAENKFENIALLLNQTRVKAAEFVFNTTSFIAENDRLIDEINGIIAGLEDIHSRLNRINSPINLATMELNTPYLSLQPPPGRSIDDAIQFESLELFFGTSAAFTTPSVLFYAGPVYQSERDVLNAGSTSTEDYFLLTVEANGMLQLLWSMGGRTGMLSNPFSSGFENWIVVTRHGSEFQLRYGTSSLGQGQGGGDNRNGTVLFRVSERTAFLVGGWPKGAQLGVPSSIITLSQYSTFQGQFQLILFNGEQWGLWNIRGSSDTDFIGRFLRNRLVPSNIWQSPSVAFDGSGYLFVDELSDSTSTPNFLSFDASIRPRDGRNALILYAYDETLSVSLEMAYVNGKLQYRIYRHDNNRVLLENIPEGPAPVNSAQVAYFANIGFIGNPNPGGDEIFFGNLQNVKAWIGGVNTDLLQQPFVPQLSNDSFYGCIALTRTEESSTFTQFRGAHFTTKYLGSPEQKGFSGTCLRTTYASEVGFSGDPNSYLSFTVLLLHTPVNDDPTIYGSSRNGRSVISFSMFPNQAKGVVFAAQAPQESTTVVIFFSGGQLLVEIRNADNNTRLSSIASNVSIQVWHQVLLEMTSSEFTLYLDGIVQERKGALPNFRFLVPTVTSNTEVIFVGGAPSSVLPLAVTIPDRQFEGCIKDLAFNFNAMDLFSSALAPGRRNLTGVTYHTCPFFEFPTIPLLAVHPVAPQERVCLASAPQELPNTHGAFHKSTALITGNVVGLLASSWTFSLLLRQVDNGHVLTITSTQGHVVRLLVRNGQAVLSLYGEGIFAEAPGLPLANGVFTPVVISCEVELVNESLSCSLSVGEPPLEGVKVRVPYSVGPTFFPSLPLYFGALSDDTVTDAAKIESFVGCIQDLAINGDSRGFSDVTTGLGCFNGTRAGQGFLGISRIGLFLSEATSHTIQFQFQPQLDNGLLLLLSESNGTVPTLTVGLFNGNLRVADLSRSRLSESQELGLVCDPANPVAYNFSLQFNATHTEVSISAGGGGVANTSVLPFTAGNNPLLLTIGNTPSEVVVPETSELFGFLLNDDRPQGNIPPGFTGCITDVTVDGSALSLYNEVVVEDILEGYCPTA